MDDTFVAAASMDISLTHGADQEHLVIHCQPVQDAGDQNRHKAEQRSACVKTKQGMQPAPLVDGCGQAEGSEDAEDKADRCFDRNDDRPEYEQQDDQRQDHNDADIHRKCVGKLGGHIDVDRSEAGHTKCYII
ncbi:hypothetical protein D3C86_1645540 [compost metagenome]